jgi:hypothetical protein
MQWRLLHFNPLRLAARLVSQSHGAERRQLAMPDRSSDRLIRDLRAKPARVAVPAAQLLATVAEPQAAADLPHA